MSIDPHEIHWSDVENSRGFRSAVVIAGERAWGRNVLLSLLSQNQYLNTCWMSADPPEGVRSILPEKFQQCLGLETDFLVFDTLNGFNVDSLAAMTGTLRGGGCFFLLTPSFDQWAYSSDDYFDWHAYGVANESRQGSFFIQRFIRLLKQSTFFIKYEQASPQNISSRFNVKEPLLRQHASVEETVDQHKAIKAIISVAQGHRRRPLVLTADRGRGKTAALGIAAAHLLRDKTRRIVITAPRMSAIETALIHAQNLLPDFERSKQALFLGDAALVFIPPDIILSEQPKADLLLIDEAAAIPVAMLEKLLRNYSRVVFSSTIHGYEGTGRGFELRFKAVLNRLTPQWKSFHLKTPVRWSSGDPLERFIFTALLLNAETCSHDDICHESTEDVLFEELDSMQLLANERQLSELFGLLVQAHYRTTPSDLRMLLDVPALRIFVLSLKGHIVAASLWMMEGGFSEAISVDIVQGKRRLRGHLLPQSLAQHLGFEQAAQLKAARIVRVAVHPGLQRQGLGRLLIKKAGECMQAAVDYIGASFGGTPELLEFWRSCNFVPVRVGFKREAASGEYTLMVCRGVSLQGKSLINDITYTFHAQFPLQLGEFYRDLDVNLILALLHNPISLALFPFTAHEQQHVQAFGEGYQSYENCCGALWKWLINLLARPNGFAECSVLDQGLIVKKILQKNSWESVTDELQLGNSKSAMRLLRQTIQRLCNKQAG